MTDPLDPPGFAEWLLKRFVPTGEGGASIVGDLREEFVERVRAGGAAAARVLYRRQVLSIAVNFAGEPLKKLAARAPRGGWWGHAMILFDELRLSTRALVRRPLFAAAVVATLAVGIGANATVFSIADDALFAPLPYPDPDRLVGVFHLNANVARLRPSTRDIVTWYAVPFAIFRDWQDRSRVFEHLGAFALTEVTIRTGDAPERVRGAVVTSGVFSALGVAPALGAVLTTDDDRVGAPGRVVLGHAFWQQRFGGSRAVVDQTLIIDGAPYAIAGVMPEGFGFPEGGEQLWLTVGDGRRADLDRRGGFLQVLGRLRPDVSVRQAQLAMEDLARRLAEEHPEDRGVAVRVLSRAEVENADARPGLLLVLGAVAAVLLLMCANIANLVLVRATERRKEIGIRQALGAGRARLLWHLIGECLVLSLAGGAAGLVLAAVARRPLIASLPAVRSNAGEMAIDHRVLLFTLAVSTGVGLLIGLLPALRASGTSVVEALRDVGRGSAGSVRRTRMQGSLVISQVALAFLLLSATGLLVRSFVLMTTTPFGFDPDRVLTAAVALPQGYRSSSDAMRASFEELTRRLRAIPGVQAVATISQPPFEGLSFPPTSVKTATGIQDLNVHSGWVSPGYFGVMGIPLVLGRDFSADDRSGSMPVAIVNRLFARRFWPGKSPIGQQVRVNIPVDGQSRWLTVVGVASDIRYSHRRQPFPEIYLPYAQSPVFQQTVVMKTSLAPDELGPAVRVAARAVDPEIPVAVSSLKSRVDRALTGDRSRVRLFLVIAALAGLLAALGTYSVLAYVVAQRTHEFGIRLAIGEGRLSVMASVMRRGLLLGAAGLGIGWTAALALSRALRSVLFTVSPTDPVTMGAVAGLVVFVVVIASYLPARRATRISLTQALKNE